MSGPAIMPDAEQAAYFCRELEAERRRHEATRAEVEALRRGGECLMDDAAAAMARALAAEARVGVLEGALREIVNKIAISRVGITEDEWATDLRLLRSAQDALADPSAAPRPVSSACWSCGLIYMADEKDCRKCGTPRMISTPSAAPATGGEEEGLDCPHCEGSGYTLAGLDCYRCQGTGLAPKEGKP